MSRYAPPRLIQLRDDLLRRRAEQLRETARDSLYEFFQQAWSSFDPSPFMGNWHLGALAEHLEAVNDGEITRLVINVPPRTSKTNLIGIAWPVWTWIQPDINGMCGPRAQFMTISYSQTLALQSSEKSKRLIDSPWFHREFKDSFHLLADADRKADFTNNYGGKRITTSVGGTLTGMGGDIIIIDDPNPADKAESKADRDRTNTWFSEALPTRLNNQRTGALVVVQQRLHTDDVTGHILSGDRAEDWTHIMLPMEYDSSRPCFCDMRTMDGELLWPERFDRQAIDRLGLSPYAKAGQLQQQPAPRGGGIIKDEWWQVWDKRLTPPFDYIVASLDTAMTEKDSSDFSAMTVFGVFQQAARMTAIDETGYDFVSGAQDVDGDSGRRSVIAAELPKILLTFAWHQRLDLEALVLRVRETCARYKVDLLVIENKSRGHDVQVELVRMLRVNPLPMTIQMYNPMGDKESRLYAVQALFSEGMIYAPYKDDGSGNLVPKSWVDAVLTQVSQFPKAANDDLVDCVTMALHALRMRGFAARKEEAAQEVRALTNHRPRGGALYPA